MNYVERIYLVHLIKFFTHLFHNIIPINYFPYCFIRIIYFLFPMLWN